MISFMHMLVHTYTRRYIGLHKWNTGRRGFLPLLKPLLLFKSGNVFTFLLYFKGDFKRKYDQYFVRIRIYKLRRLIDPPEKTSSENICRKTAHTTNIPQVMLTTGKWVLCVSLLQKNKRSIAKFSTGKLGK